MTDFVFLTQIGDEPDEQVQPAVPIMLQIAPAVDPDPLTLMVLYPVFNTMEAGPPTSDDLIGLYGSGSVARVCLASSDGDNISHDGLWEAGFPYHRW